MLEVNIVSQSLPGSVLVVQERQNKQTNINDKETTKILGLLTQLTFK